MPTPITTLVLHSGEGPALPLATRLQEGALVQPWLRFLEGPPPLPVDRLAGALQASGLARQLNDREVSHYQLSLSGAAPDGQSGDVAIAGAVLLRWMAEELDEYGRLADPYRPHPVAGRHVVLTGSAALVEDRRSSHFDPILHLDHKLDGLARWLEGCPDRAMVLLLLAKDQDTEDAAVKAALDRLRQIADLEIYPVETIAQVAQVAAEALLEALDSDLAEAQITQACELAQKLSEHRSLLVDTKKEIVDALFRLGSQNRRAEDLVFEQRAGKMTLCAEATGGWLVVDHGEVRRIGPGGAAPAPIPALAALRGVEVLCEGDQDVYLARTGPYGTRVYLFKHTPAGRWEVEDRPLECPDGVVALQRHQRWAVGRGSRLYLWDLHATFDDPHDVHHPHQTTTGGLLALDVLSGGNTFAVLGGHQDAIWLYDVEVKGPKLDVLLLPFAEAGLRPARAVQPLREDRGWLLATLHEPGPAEQAFRLAIWQVEALLKEERRVIPTVQLSLPGVDHQLSSVVLAWTGPRHLVLAVGSERGSRPPVLWHIDLSADPRAPIRLSAGPNAQLQPMHRLVQAVSNRPGTHLALLDHRGLAQVVDLARGPEGSFKLKPTRLERSLEGEVVWASRAWSFGPDKPEVHHGGSGRAESVPPLKKLLSEWMSSDSPLKQLAARGATAGPLQPLCQELNVAYTENDFATIRGIERGLDGLASTLQRPAGPSSDVRSEGTFKESLAAARAEVQQIQALLRRPVGAELSRVLLHQRMSALFAHLLPLVPPEERAGMVAWRLARAESGEPVSWERQPDQCPSLAVAYEDIRRRLVGLGFVVEHPALAKGERI